MDTGWSTHRGQVTDFRGPHSGFVFLSASTLLDPTKLPPEGFKSRRDEYGTLYACADQGCMEGS